MINNKPAYRFSLFHRTIISIFLVFSLLAGIPNSFSANARPAGKTLSKPSNPFPAQNGYPAPVSYPAYLPLAIKNGNSSAGEAWLAYLNQYREMGRLSPLAVNKEWGKGGWYHSRYMVKNDEVGHGEDPANAWYTQEGHLAAESGNLVGSWNKNATDKYAIDAWMQAPFHAVGILDPALQSVGFGSFREQDGGVQMGATLDVLRGQQEIPASVRFPVIWPGDGSVVPIGSHWGEYPNPLSSCPGYSAPSGLPIILQLGAGQLTPSVSRHNIKAGSTILEHCFFDETNYTNPEASAQSLGRAILDLRDAIVLIPRQPLVPGTTYTVSITVNGRTYGWSFRVGNGASLATSEGEFFFPGTQLP
jgi:uncharacterized protein YkwD